MPAEAVGKNVYPAKVGMGAVHPGRDSLRIGRFERSDRHAPSISAQTLSQVEYHRINASRAEAKIHAALGQRLGNDTSNRASRAEDQSRGAGLTQRNGFRGGTYET